MVSCRYNTFVNFCRKYVTKTDLVMGGLLIGGLFFKRYICWFDLIYRDAFGCHYLIPKLCGAYFAGKASLCILQKKNPSLYGEISHGHSTFVNKLWNMIVPDDFLK